MYLDSFHDLTAATYRMEAGSVLMPAPQFSGQGQITAGFQADVQSYGSVLYITKTSYTGINDRWFSFWVNVPLDSGYNVQVQLSKPRGEDDTWSHTIVAPAKHYMSFDGRQPGTDLYYFLESNCTIQISLLTSDYKTVLDGANKIFKTANWPSAFSWTSKPFHLSDFLVGITKLELKLTDGSTRSAVLDWSRVGRSGYTPPSLTFDSVWKAKLYLAKEQNGNYVEFTRLPLPSEVVQGEYRWAKLVIYGSAPTTGAPIVGVEEVVLGLAEEYASSAPTLEKRVTRSNLYVPRLQVTVSGVDVTKYVVSASNTEVTILDNSDWVRSACQQGASISVMLDGQLIVSGLVGEMRKEQYLNGNVLSIRILRPIDFIGRSEDVEIVVRPDSVTGQLPFADDLGYIAYLVNSVVTGARVMADDRTGWRPFSVWKQRPSAGEHRFVQLDTDFDWLQLYAVNNSSVREKVERVAQANGFMVSSFAGNVYLTPIAPYPNDDLLTLYNRARILHMTKDGKFFPEVRFGVPELSYSDSAPKELALVGLADAVSETLPKFRAVFKRADNTWTDELAINGFYPRTQGDTFVRVDNQYYRAVFKSLTVNIRHIEGADLSPFFHNRPYYKFIYGTISGYYGIVAVELWMAGGVLEYDEYYLSAEGELLYYDGGQRNDTALWKATGRYAPKWAQFNDGTNLVGHLLTIGNKLNGPKETIENPFVPKYSMPTVTVNGQQVELDTYQLGNYTVYKDYGDRLTDMLATRKALERVVATMPVVGPAGFKVNDVVGIARLPEDGIGGKVREVDLYLVLEEPEIQVSPGGQVRSTVRMGYMGTIRDGQPVYDDMAVSWSSLPPGTDTWYL
jgi:hypothetical protein